MIYDRKDLTHVQLIEIYRRMLTPRMIEEKMLVLLRQGRISKWFSGIGQEAIAVGATMALEQDEWIMPLHRNLGVFTTRGMPLHSLFRQWQGSKDGYSKGRERSFHFGAKEHHVCGMISHLGPQLAIADGVALAYKLASKDKVSLAFTGDGGTSEGDFHEALNVAAVWDLPVIFIVENNGYGLSTPVSEQYRCESLVDRAKGYGMEGVQIDGNNILTVLDTLKGVRDYCIKNQKPYLIECMTFRMRGHEEASGVKYVPKELFELWGQRDPVQNFETYLALKDGSWGAMGGLITTVEDFSKYIKLHLQAWPIRDGKETGPLKRSSIREMHQLWNFNTINPKLNNKNCAAATGYGYGLGITRDCRGNIYVAHSGGLPGFGSSWMIKPNYNIGIVIMSNRTYSPVSRLSLPILDSLVVLAGLQPYGLPASAILEQRKSQLMAILPEWKNAEQQNIFAENFFPDNPIGMLRQQSRELFAKAGTIKEVKPMKPENNLRGSFDVIGENATLRIYFTLSPEHDPKIQEYRITEIKNQ